MKKENKLKHFLDDITKLKKISTSRYEYQYFLFEDDNIIFDTKNNKEYSSSRKDFERWKKDNVGINYVDIPGVISLRRIVNKKNKKVIGYITEEKIKNNIPAVEAKELYEKAYNEVSVILGITDKDAFDYYFEEYEKLNWDFSMNPINVYCTKTQSLYDLAEKYLEDSEFRHMMDNITKKIK